jgi:Protein of unknown function (DUF2946)
MLNSRHLMLYAKLVLALFMIHVGLSIATPLLKSTLYDEICTSFGVTKQLVKSDIFASKTESAQHQHGLDCPLCSPFLNAPPTALSVLYQAVTLAAQQADRSHPHIATRQSAVPPLPARGPPIV